MTKKKAVTDVRQINLYGNKDFPVALHISKGKPGSLKPGDPVLQFDMAAFKKAWLKGKS